MDVEAKIKTLEQEVKILKNQIQQTLLDIHEQVLVHYYPSLRVEAPDDDEHRAGEAAKGSAKGSSRKDRSTDAEKAAPEPESLPNLLLQPPIADGAELQYEADQSIFDRMVEWLDLSVGKIGKARIEDLIKIQIQGGILDDTIGETLLQLLTLSDEEKPPESVGMKDILQIQMELNKILSSQTREKDESPVLETLKRG